VSRPACERVDGNGNRVLADIEEARRKSCGSLTLRELVQEAMAGTRPSLTLAARRD